MTMLGMNHSNEAKRKISVGLSGRKLSAEHKRKLSIYHQGRVHTEETKKKISESKKGKVMSKEFRKKLSIILKGKRKPTFSKEHLKNMSNSQKGKKHTEETKRKISASCKGKEYSKETYKKMSESKIGMKNPMWGKMGELHHNWQGGISFEPYCELWGDKEFKNYIKERDGYKCLNPQCRGKSNRFGIHHIDYVKKNCDRTNLVYLCFSCNAKANYHRERYTRFYRKLLTLKYGYQYN